MGVDPRADGAHLLDLSRCFPNNSHAICENRFALAIAADGRVIRLTHRVEGGNPAGDARVLTTAAVRVSRAIATPVSQIAWELFGKHLDRSSRCAPSARGSTPISPTRRIRPTRGRPRGMSGSGARRVPAITRISRSRLPGAQHPGALRGRYAVGLEPMDFHACFEVWSAASGACSIRPTTSRPSTSSSSRRPRCDERRAQTILRPVNAAPVKVRVRWRRERRRGGAFMPGYVQIGLTLKASLCAHAQGYG